MSRLAALVASMLLTCGLAFAQLPGGPTSVAVLPIQPVAVTPGGSSPLIIVFRVANGMHINSNKPTSELLIPTQVKLTAPTELMVGNIQYPAGQEFRIPVLPDEKLSVYSGTVKLRGLVSAPQNASKGTFRVHGELKYQACSDRQCFPPKTTPFAFDVKISRHTR